MRVTTRFAAIALWVLCLAALPSMADDIPWAHLEGYRCEIPRDGETPPGIPGSTILVCHIDDEPNPFGGHYPSPTHTPPTSPTLDSLLNLLSTVDKTRHDTSQQRHRAVVRKPTP